MADDLTTEITEAAAAPQSIAVDGTTLANRPLSELIEADKHLASRAAAAARRPGFRLVKLLPPGMT